MQVHVGADDALELELRLVEIVLAAPQGVVAVEAQQAEPAGGKELRELRGTTELLLAVLVLAALHLGDVGLVLVGGQRTVGVGVSLVEYLAQGGHGGRF